MLERSFLFKECHLGILENNTLVFSFDRRSQEKTSEKDREEQRLQQEEQRKREQERLEQLRMKAIQQQQKSTSKVELKYHASTAVRPGEGFGFGQVTTGQVSSRKYEILTRASSVGRAFEERGDLNPDLIRAQSVSARGSPAPIGMSQKVEVDASQQMMSKSAAFAKQADFASTTAALSTGLTRRQTATTSVSKMSSSEMKSVSSQQVIVLVYSFQIPTEDQRNISSPA